MSGRSDALQVANKVCNELCRGLYIFFASDLVEYLVQIVARLVGDN